MATAERGRFGEELAAKFLRKKRYKIVEMNYRCRMGEIDLIVENRHYLVFVEVKLRKNADFAQAMEFVDFHKQNRLKRTAMLYLSQNETEKQCRFDVIEIYVSEDLKKPQIRHLEDAFE